MRGTFLLPIDGHDPPAIAVVEQLNAVDPAHERFRIVYGVARFVRAPDVRDMPELFRAPRNFALKESVLLQVIADARDEAVDIQHVRRDLAAGTHLAGIFRRRYQTRAGNEQGTLTVPITLTWRA